MVLPNQFDASTAEALYRLVVGADPSRLAERVVDARETAHRQVHFLQ